MQCIFSEGGGVGWLKRKGGLIISSFKEGWLIRGGGAYLRGVQITNQEVLRSKESESNCGRKSRRFQT